VVDAKLLTYFKITWISKAIILISLMHRSMVPCFYECELPFVTSKQLTKPLMLVTILQALLTEKTYDRNVCAQ
jgi:hypothetical protein